MSVLSNRFFSSSMNQFQSFSYNNAQQDKQHKSPQSRKFRNKTRIYFAVYFSTMTAKVVSNSFWTLITLSSLGLSGSYSVWYYYFQIWQAFEENMFKESHRPELSFKKWPWGDPAVSLKLFADWGHLAIVKSQNLAIHILLSHSIMANICNWCKKKIPFKSLSHTKNGKWSRIAYMCKKELFFTCNDNNYD